MSEDSRLIPGELKAVAGLWGRAVNRGARLYLGELQRSERVARSLLRRWLDLPPELPAGGDGARSRPVVAGEPADAMEALLERSLEQSPQAGRDELFGRLVAQLTPDEARMLAALSEGAGAALVHVENRSGRRLLENASTLGRTAGLSLPDSTRTYLESLRRLGLIEEGPEAAERKLDYEILLADQNVREAIKSTSGPLPGRALKRTIRLSLLGRELWAVCSRTDAAR